MVTIFIELVLALLGVIVVYEVIIAIIRRVTGCSQRDAEDKIRRVINKTPDDIAHDPNLENDITERVKAVMGSVRFKDIESLFYAGISWIYYGYGNNLPYVEVSLYLNDETERMKLKLIICNVIKQYLQAYSFSTDIIPKWERNDSLALDILHIYYCRNEREHDSLLEMSKMNINSIANKNSDLVEDEDDEDDKK